MKRTLLIATIAGLFVTAAIAGCDTRIEESPIEIAESTAIKSIEQGGSDPDLWNLSGECVAMGPCNVDAGPAELPEVVLATDLYTVKDSRASLNGTDRIRVAAERVTRNGCFENITTEAKLRDCLARP